MAQSLYWYDLETFGLNPGLDRIAQFAGVRTNEKFELIGDPLVIYNRITPDYVPDPKACLITGITPGETLEKGITSYEFSKIILEEFSKPGTCVTGYNSLNFDDEFIRNLFYRNFFDPYEREWANGNSRWDILDLLRAAHDLRPEGINWVKNEKGIPSFKLELLTKANNISHKNAHDALSDVYATIDMARLVHEKQPKLFSYVFNHRQKNSVRDLVDLYKKEPVLFTTAAFTSKHGCTSIIAPLATDPSNSNLVYAWDLRFDPEAIIQLQPEEIKKRFFTRNTELEESEKLHLTAVHINKCPVLSPLSILDQKTANRLDLNVKRSLAFAEKLKKEPLLTQKILKAFSTDNKWSKTDTDPELQIYSGGFFKDSDKKKFSVIHNTPGDKIFSLKLDFEDPRIGEMLWRFSCRNFPGYMDENTKKQWKSFCAGRILSPPGKLINDFNFFKRKVEENMANREIGSREKVILKDLEMYAELLEKEVLSF